MPDPRPDTEETVRLLNRVRQGDLAARGELLARSRDSLQAFLTLHFDRKLRGRVDPSDVVQETMAKVDKRLAGYLSDPPMPFHLWVRRTGYELLLNARRYHRADRRDVDREAGAPDSSSVSLACRLVANGPTPSEAAVARERTEQMTRAIEGMKDEDRQVLLLRHLEDLPHADIACLLGISEEAERQRYGRALIRLEKALAKLGVSGGVA